MKTLTIKDIRDLRRARGRRVWEEPLVLFERMYPKGMVVESGRVHRYINEMSPKASYTHNSVRQGWVACFLARYTPAWLVRDLVRYAMKRSAAGHYPRYRRGGHPLTDIPEHRVGLYYWLDGFPAHKLARAAVQILRRL